METREDPFYSSEEREDGLHESPDPDRFAGAFTEEGYLSESDSVSRGAFDSAEDSLSDGSEGSSGSPPQFDLRQLPPLQHEEQELRPPRPPLRRRKPRGSFALQTTLIFGSFVALVLGVAYVSLTGPAKPALDIALAPRGQQERGMTPALPIDPQQMGMLAQVLKSLTVHLQRNNWPCLCMCHLNVTAPHYQVCAIRDTKSGYSKGLLDPALIGSVLPREGLGGACKANPPPGVFCALEYSRLCPVQSTREARQRSGEITLEWTPPHALGERHWMSVRGDAAHCMQLALEEMAGRYKCRL